jgi:hypothetical protein
MHDTPPPLPEFACDAHALTAAHDSAEALPSAAAVEPNLPVAIYLHQGAVLTKVSERDRQALLDAGCDRASLEQLSGRLAWLRDADTQWQVRRTGKGQTQKEREKAAVDLRDETLADLRWWLRHDPAAQAHLDGIAEGEGLADALHDLDELALLVDEHAPSWPTAAKVNPTARAQALRQAAEAAREGAATWKADPTSDALKLSRDKAFAWAEAAVREVRAAGRYAFRKQPGTLVDYRDGYAIAKAHKQRKRAAAAAGETAPQA